MESTLRMQFFALGLLLEALCASDAVEQFEKLSVSHTDRRKRVGLLLGYELVIKTILYKQIELIVVYPEILGRQQADENLLRWWSDSETKYANRFRRVIRDDAPESAFIGNHINNLLMKVNRSGDKIEQFTEVASSVSSFAQTILSMTGNCRLLVSTESGAVQEIDHALRLCAAEYLHDFIYHNFRYDRKDYTLDDADVYARADSRRWESGSILEDYEVSRVETSRDIVGRRPISRYSSHEHLLLGINAAVAISLHQMELQEQVLYRECDDLLMPDDELFGDLLEQFQAGNYPSQKYKLTLWTGVPKQTLATIMSFESLPMDSREQLSDLLGDRAFLASGLSSNVEFHFRVIIEGLLGSMLPDQKVEVLRIDHAGEDAEAHPPVSLAVLVGGDWQVFYYIDAIGRMKSSAWPLIERLGDRINLTRIEDVGTNDLLRLCDRAFQYVACQWKAQKDLNGHLRGAIPELLAGLLLASKGYRPVKVARKLKLNRKDKEIDAIGIRESEDGGKCLLVETKKRSTTQNQLRTELEEFAQKVELVRENIQAVGQVMGYFGSIQEVSGLFISMADVGELADRTSEEGEPNDYFFEQFVSSSTKKVEAEFKDFLNSLWVVDFWDYNRFNSELQAAGLPELPIRLLERAYVTWELPDINMAGWPVPIDALAQAVESDFWQWPGGVESVQVKLDEMLRGDEGAVDGRYYGDCGTWAR